jgi:hypothetical protein
MSITYTDTEVTRMVNELKGYKEKQEELAEANSVIARDMRTQREKVRDFFSEGQWDDGEFTASKEDVNELLSSIGTNRLTTKYRASYTVTGTFSVDAEDADDAEAIFTDNLSVDFYDGDIDVDQIEVLDIEEDN